MELAPLERRLFFALWPSQALRTALDDVTRPIVEALGGRRVPVENFHVTLAFLGRVPESRLTQLVSIAEGTALEIGSRASQVTLTFDRIDYWREARIVCAVARTDGAPPIDARLDGTAGGGTDLTAGALNGMTAGALNGMTAGALNGMTAGALAELLKMRLRATGFEPDPKPFRPHVTLARKVRPFDTHPLQPITGGFTRFALIDSRTLPEGPSYSVLKSWTLCGERAQKP